MSPRFSLAEETAWYGSLPTMYGSAAALITSAAGDVLLVKPNYRDHWSLPGGILEDGEAPPAGCAREVREELGLSVPVGPLVAIDWLAPAGSRPRPTVAFIFDGGELTDPSAIVLQESELDDWRFVPPPDLAGFVPPHLLRRITAGLLGRDSGAGSGAVYVPALAGDHDREDLFPDEGSDAHRCINPS